MKWSKEEILILKKFYSSTKTRDIATRLQKSLKAIYHKSSRLGLSKEKSAHNRPIDKWHRQKYDRQYYSINKQNIYLKKKLRKKRFKERLIKLKGGKCQSCKYNKCIAALEFHHVSSNKENSISRLLDMNSKQKILKEVNKCNLLCANCHRELHYSKGI